MQDATNKNISRRNLIKAAAGLGAGAAVGLPAVVFLTRGDEHMAPAVSASDASGAVAAGQPIVAYVRDAAAGEVVVMFGSSETVVTDRQLVMRLTGLAQG